MAGNDNNRKGRRYDKRQKNNFRGGKNNSKKVEVDVKASDINKADMPHVVTSAQAENDVSWYTHIYPAAADVASVPYNIPVGTSYNPLDTTNMGSDSVQANATATVAPGVMTFRILPTVGEATSPNSPINIAAQQIYTLARAKNSGAKNYDKTDVMLVIMAMDSAYMLYESLVRVYKCLGTYNYMNRYMPEALVNAQGFDYKSFASNMADFRGKLNLFAYQLGSINIPDQFDIIHRHSWMFTNVYRDADIQKAQLYQYRLAGVYVWTEGQEEQPTYLEYKSLSELAGETGLIGYDKIQKMIDAVMDPLLGSQDVGVISGDLAKAFGEGGMIKIQPISEGEAIVPVYSQEVLLQMMNLEQVEHDFVNIDIKVDNTNLVSGPFLTQKLSFSDAAHWVKGALKHFINVPINNPDYGTTLIATRLQFNVESDDDKLHTLTDYGTEVCRQIFITTIAEDGSVSNKEYSQILYGLTNNANTWLNNMTNVIAWSKFDWSPTLHVFTGSSASDSNMLYQYLGHIQDDMNYTFINKDTLRNIHNIAIMSEFAVKDYKSNM